MSKEIKLPNVAKKIAMGGFVVFVPVAIGVGTTIVDGDPRPAILWFSAAAASAVVAIFLWDEFNALSYGWRIGITVTTVVFTLICVNYADSWVSSKAEEKSEERISLFARESVSDASPPIHKPPLTTELESTPLATKNLGKHRRSEAEPNVDNCSNQNLVTELRSSASRIHAEWKTYWEGEDLYAFNLNNHLRARVAEGDDSAKKDLEQLTKQRAASNDNFKRKYKASIREVRPLALQSVKRLGGLATLEDKELSTIIDDLLKEKITENLKRGDFANYLDDLANRYERSFTQHPEP